MCEQPYSDYRDGQISPAMAAQREPYLPVLYPWRRERESVCVCTSVRGGALLDLFYIVFPPHEPSHMVGGQERNKHKSGLGPVAVPCRLSRTEKLYIRSFYFVFLSIITLSVLLSPLLAAALFSAAHLELPVPLPV